MSANAVLMLSGVVYDLLAPHHCRCCGRTLCNEHSSKQIPLPQFGIHSAVRVCNDCFNNSTHSSNVNTETVSNDIDVVASSDIGAAAFNDSDTAVTNFSRLDLNEDNVKDSKSQNISQSVECKCGMPLCICQAPSLPQVQPVVPPTSNYQRPKKLSNIQQGSSNASSKSSASSSGSSKSSVFFNSGQMTNGTMETNSKDYETSGEGLREAIKNGDVSAVKELLMQGVDANYCDKQGMSLLHLATVFNHTEITFILMNAGANVDAKNAQGETPLDCAQTMLQYKMHQKMQEAGHR
ncbi:uncharacterized protein LOC131070224 isoform X2 [Cryptomeria japonica]|uniref:uncharacterized protein LOC131070224 isoform X2 n=1 Tax=Cryptomeria japonica TaxID=3369 RepID=UPI0025AB7BB4|nr:uncharacterized protein LOC131070224 isoform X2 [Cryptomeria japonica]